MSRPQTGDFAPYAIGYINLVQGTELASAMAAHSQPIRVFFQELPENLSRHRYAPGKWSLNEVLQHIIDAERIFSYRALTFARRDQTALPGFDENSYALNSHADERDWNGLLQEFLAVRTATDMLYGSFTVEDLTQRGLANQMPTTVNAFCFITYGHILHHINIIKERYLPFLNKS